MTGQTSEGEAYHANDPVLLDWVQATAGFGFTQAYHAYARDLTGGERASLLTEAAPAARLYGAKGAPPRGGLDALFETMKPRLVPSPIIFEFLEIMRKTSILPGATRTLQPMLVKAAVGIVPDWIRERLGLDSAWNLNPINLPSSAPWRKQPTGSFLPSSPAAIQSCRRMGLPDTYLYET